MPTYKDSIIGPTGPVATERIEAPDADGAGQLALEFVDQLLDFGQALRSA